MKPRWEIYTIPAGGGWDDILRFKKAHKEEHWGFRRFLASLATKKLTPAEIHDEIALLVTQYSKAMQIQSIKASRSFLEVYVIPTMEVFEDVVKLKWSKIAKGVLSIKKRRVELLEAEMKAPGRECAYLFSPRKRFGKRD